MDKTILDNINFNNNTIEYIYTPNNKKIVDAANEAINSINDEYNKIINAPGLFIRCKNDICKLQKEYMQKIEPYNRIISEINSMTEIKIIYKKEGK